ncbi:toll/interleukin-1 receptor domain-containing protein [Frankia sp. CiP3]|uniref:toll/interleukin-1 receptor domain-containing protein n=1 Tax=Frankia sp. CiP3 TaxID=2880971 RepID=UPI001EF3FBA0|nr:toll/interleukin-1 receptor domain-containing protein [Frankia sp. CiP3]
MPVAEPAGFFSYAHADNENEDGNILALAEGIRKQYALVSAGKLNMFDDQNLRWGDIWRDRVNKALSATTFFIPVITPTYFERPECRRELIEFHGKLKQLSISKVDISQLLLPILYVEVDDLLEDSADELKSLIAGTQYADWTELRWLNPSDGARRKALAELARTLYSRATELDTRQLPITDYSVPSDDDSSPGVMDLLAEGEAAIPRWLDNLQKFAVVIQRVGLAVQEATDEIKKNDSSGKGFAGRISVFRSLAVRLDESTEDAVRLGDEYSSLLMTIDPAIRTLIDYSFSPQLDTEEKAQISELVENIRILSHSSEANRESLSQFVSSFATPAKMSKDLRPHFRKLEAGLQRVVDGDAVIQQWNRAIEKGSSEALAE